jgi:hypothetical protein
MLGSIILAGCVRTRRSEVTLVPNHFVGWMTVDYNVPGAPLLPWERKEKAYVIAMPADGKYQTSSPLVSGLADDRYFWVGDAGKRTELPIAEGQSQPPSVGVQGVRFIKSAPIDGKPGRELRAFFIGSPSDYKAAPKDDAYLIRK